MENEHIKYTRSSGGVVVNKDGKILVVNQHGTTWSLPKGHIKEEEVELDAAKREIFEESGIKDLEFVKGLGSYQRFRFGKDGKEDRTELKTITMFLFRTSEELLKPNDLENPEARWIKKDEVADLLTHPQDKEFFIIIEKEI
jgi:ADP-ribose pyrophosphatase YjhB (NUDIX family)